MCTPAFSLDGQNFLVVQKALSCSILHGAEPNRRLCLLLTYEHSLLIVLVTWFTIFQIYHPAGGALGDYLSFTTPLDFTDNVFTG